MGFFILLLLVFTWVLFGALVFNSVLNSDEVSGYKKHVYNVSTASFNLVGKIEIVKTFFEKLYLKVFSPSFAEKVDAWFSK